MNNLQGNLCDQDIDGDGVLNEEDTCPGKVNPAQLADECIGDQDGDSIPQEIDNCPESVNQIQGDLLPIEYSVDFLM